MPPKGGRVSKRSADTNPLTAAQPASKKARPTASKAANSGATRKSARVKRSSAQRRSRPADQKTAKVDEDTGKLFREAAEGEAKETLQDRHEMRMPPLVKLLDIESARFPESDLAETFAWLQDEVNVLRSKAQDSTVATDDMTDNSDLSNKAYTLFRYSRSLHHYLVQRKRLRLEAEEMERHRRHAMKIQDLFARHKDRDNDGDDIFSTMETVNFKLSNFLEATEADLGKKWTMFQEAVSDDGFVEEERVEEELVEEELIEQEVGKEVAEDDFDVADELYDE